MRILLIQPDFLPGPVGFRLFAMTEPLALEVLAAAVPGHDVAILDMRIDTDLLAALERFAPEVVGVTALTTEVGEARKILQTVKQHAPEVFTVAGGHHATLIPKDFYLPYVDAICLGEGEPVFAELIDALNAARDLRGIANLVWRDPEGQFVHNGRELPVYEADAIPLPSRDLVRQYLPEYFVLFDKPDSSVVTTRGCPYRCNFCSVWEFYGGKVRQMTAPRVLEETRHVETKHITFMDDNFLINYRRELEVAERIKAEGINLHYSMQCRSDSIARHPELIEKWVDIGLQWVLLGLEGASDRMLQNVNKMNTARANDEAIRILKANGVIIWGAFIVDPQWESDDFQGLRDYVYRQGITHTQFTVLTPLPGTRLYRERYDQLLTHDYRYYDTLHAVVPTRLPREEFYRRFASLYSHLGPDASLELVSQGKLSMANLKRGYKLLAKMSQCEHYLETDPVLCRRDGGENVP